MQTKIFITLQKEVKGKILKKIQASRLLFFIPIEEEEEILVISVLGNIKENENFFYGVVLKRVEVPKGRENQFISKLLRREKYLELLEVINSTLETTETGYYIRLNQRSSIVNSKDIIIEEKPTLSHKDEIIAMKMNLNASMIPIESKVELRTFALKKSSIFKKLLGGF